MKKWLFMVVLIVVALISVFVYWQIMISPQYSLKQIKKAIAEQEVVTFDKYVDLDEVVDSTIKQVWTYYSSSESSTSKWTEIRNEIGNSILSVVKPNLKEVIKKEVYNYINSGPEKDLNSQNESSSPSLLVRMIKERADPEQWEYQTINYVEKRGDIAFLGLTYYDRSKKTNFIIELKMRNMKGYWQLLEITNVAQLLNIF
ncbi:MAG: hypothetical protein XE03_1854 [candidate division TA06 bacterium 34_109]|uniref:DUF2939 domain-containing protein n=1 Tax=candidate division TA06 bacterium 34_109 TaxID=1635277 RepID=A0A117M5S1_UNCT6|nr:MAG: hypothetical protein XE03_1854 [candidate division TA06 bacterium 34_109]